MSFITQLFALVVVAVVAVGGTSVYFKLHDRGNAETQTAAVVATANDSVSLPPENSGGNESPAPEVKNTSVNSAEEKTTVKTAAAKSETPKTSSVIPGKVIAYITDQYGKPYNSYSSYLIQDSLGERAGDAKINNGHLESLATLPSGQYTIWIAYDNISGVALNETPVIKSFTLPPEGINLGTVIINKWTYAKVKVVNEVGTSLGSSYGLRCLVLKSEITDEFLKKYPKSMPALFPCGGGGSTFSDKMGPFPPGNYTIQISSGGYESVEKNFTINNRDVDLGTVVLKKK